MTDYKFTQDWFHWAPELWEKLTPMLPKREAFLELGSFEGRSTVWIVENMVQDGGFIDCVDTWAGGEEHEVLDMREVEKNFDRNIRLLIDKYDSVGKHANNRRVYKYKDKSTVMLGEKLQKQDTFYDFIYIDASHTAPDVLTDACLAWPLLKKDGIMVFDDYLWGDPKNILHRPKLAVDTFTNIFAEQLLPVHFGYQAVVRKK